MHQMSRYSTSYHYTPEEDPLLAGNINTVIDYRNELQGKQQQTSTASKYNSATASPQRSNSNFMPHSADYYLTHDITAEESRAAQSRPWHTPDPQDEDPCLAGQMNTVMDYRAELSQKQSQSNSRTPTRCPPKIDYLADDFDPNSPTMVTSTTRTSYSAAPSPSRGYSQPRRNNNNSAARSKAYNPYLDDDYVDALVGSGGKSTPWHTPDLQDEDPCLAGQMNTLVDYRNELEAKQTKARGSRNPRLTTNYLDDEDISTRPLYTGGNPRLNQNYYADDVQLRSNVSNPRINPSYLDDDLPIRPTSNGRDPRINPSYMLDDEVAQRKSNIDDPRIHPSYMLDDEVAQRKSNIDDPRIHPSYMLDDEIPQRKSNIDDPRIHPTYMLDDEVAQLKANERNPRIHPSYYDDSDVLEQLHANNRNPHIHPSYYDDSDVAELKANTKNPRLNQSYYNQNGTNYIDDDEVDTIPWHTPDLADESPCLAGQMNVLVDYRNELASKSNGQRKVNRWQNVSNNASAMSAPVSPRGSYSNSRIAGDDDVAASYRTQVGGGYGRQQRQQQMGYGAYENDSDAETMPWHTPDLEDEDPCLAGQMNVLVDYRNELASKKFGGSASGSAIYNNPDAPSSRSAYASSAASTASGRQNQGFQKKNAASEIKGESVPWHLPDYEDEDQCLAGQMNVLVDYRNDLKAKQAALSPKTKPQPPSPYQRTHTSAQQLAQEKARNAPPPPPKQPAKYPYPSTSPQQQQQQQHQQLHQQSQQQQKGGFRTYSAPTSPRRPQQQQQQQQAQHVSFGNVSQRQQMQQPQRSPIQTSTSSRLQQQQMSPKTTKYVPKQYASYEQNASQIGYKYTTNGDDDNSSEDDYNLSDSISSDDEMERRYAQRASSKRSEKKNLHNALNHLDNASRILDSV